MVAIRTQPTASSLHQLQARFVSLMLPRIETHAKVYFRQVKCPVRKQDFIAETVAIAWKWVKRLAEKGRDALGFVSQLATYAAKAVKSGRRLCGQLKPKDVLSEKAQQQHGFVVCSIPDYSTLGTNPMMDALIDNTQSPVPDQVAFRCDFPRWLRSHARRDRRIIQAMAMRERTLELSEKFKLSPARISQLRREYHKDWELFTAAPEQTDDPTRNRSPFTKGAAPVLDLLRRLRQGWVGGRHPLHRKDHAQLNRLVGLAAEIDELLITGQAGPDTRKQLQVAREDLESRIRSLITA
jgi:hypothetical protein